MYCPYCCAMIPADEVDDSTKCLRCGEDLSGIQDESGRQCPACGADAPEDAKYCWSCGETIDDAAES